MWNRSRFKPYEASPVFANGNSSQALPPGTVHRGQLAEDALYPPGMVSGAYDGNSENSSAYINHSRTGDGTIGASTPQGARSTGVRDAAAATSQGAGASIPQQSGAVDPIYLGAGAQMTKFPIKIDANVLQRGKSRFEIYCAPCHARDGYGNGMVVQRGFAQPPSFHSERLRKAPVGHYFEVITNGYGAMYSYASRVSPEDRWAIIAYIRALQLSQHPEGVSLPAGVNAKPMEVPDGLVPGFRNNTSVTGNPLSKDVESTPEAAQHPAQPEKLAQPAQPTLGRRVAPGSAGTSAKTPVPKP
jgi:mono/diheme cytochrome c family protein